MNQRKTRYKNNSQKTRQARASGGDVTDKLNTYLYIHAHALFSSLGRLMRTRFTSIMTIVAMAIAISLVGGFYILVANVQQLTGNLETSNQISVFLKLDVSDERGRELVNQLSRNDDIEQITLITKQQALQEFQTYSGFGDALKALHNNPLPTVIQILPGNSLFEQARIDALLEDVRRLPEVDFAQMDMQWVQRLQSIMTLARRGVGLLSVILALAVIFITGNTIRLELQNRKDEVVIAKLVGATNGFIQRPFLYCGLWYGLFAGITAWAIVTIMLLVLQQPIEKLSSLYDGGFQMIFLGFSDTLIFVAVSTLLGVVGAWIVLVFQLRQLKPE
jgi:cell division transport system permease protein